MPMGIANGGNERMKTKVIKLTEKDKRRLRAQQRVKARQREAEKQRRRRAYYK